MFGKKVTGLILCGGRGRRMGGIDKGLVVYRGRPLVDYAIETLKSQTNDILVNANRNIEEYQCYGYPVVSDLDPDFIGPLSGVLAGMRVAETPLMLVIPCDMPKLTPEVLRHLLDASDRSGAPLVVAHDGERLQPLLMLVSTDLVASLADYLEAGGRRVEEWVRCNAFAIVDMSSLKEALVNLNELEQLVNHGDLNHE